MENLQIIRDKFYFGMKIKQDYYFAFWRKKTTTKHHHTYLQQKRTHRVYFHVGETYIAKADAIIVSKLRHKFFFGSSHW